MDGLVAKSHATLVTPWPITHQAPLSWDFPGKNTGVGCHFFLQYIHILELIFFEYTVKYHLETRTWSLGQKDPLEKEIATDSSSLSLVGYSPWGHRESDTTTGLTLSPSAKEPVFIFTIKDIKLFVLTAVLRKGFKCYLSSDFRRQLKLENCWNFIRKLFIKKKIVYMP